MPQNDHNVALIGFGDLGKQILELSREFIDIKKFVVFDDDQKSDQYECYPFESYLDKRFEDYQFHVCLGYNYLSLKQDILNVLRDHNRRILTIIHPTSHISSTASIEEGVTIYPMCNVDSNAHIKAGSLLNNSVVVSHECLINQCCYLSPGVILSGRVSIGGCSFLGSGTVVSNDTSIGENCKVGVGSSVTKNIPNGSSAIGNPLRLLKKELRIG